MNVGDLVGIQWKKGIGYVGSKTGAHVGLILEKDNQHPALDMYIVYCPSIKAFNPVKCWDSSWLVRLSDGN